MFLTKKTPDKLSSYQDPTGEFSNRALETAAWYVRHKLLLEKIGIGFLVAWCVVSIGFGLWSWGSYLIFGLQADRLLLDSQVQNVQNYTLLQPGYRALPLKITTVDIFPSAVNRYTFVADVGNPNKAWVAYVTYRFSFSGGQTDPETAVLLPASTRPLTAFSSILQRTPANAQFEIQDIKWRRISPHAVSDIPEYMAARLGFVAEDVLLNSTSTAVATLDTTPVTFTLVNTTAYNFWDPEFAIELFQGNNRVGVLLVTVPEFLSGERRTIDVRSLAPLPGLSDIRVIPLVDIFNKDMYIEPGTY